MEVDGQRHTPATLPPEKRRGGSQGWSGRVRKISPTLGFDLWTVQPVASRYSNRVTPSHGYNSATGPNIFTGFRKSVVVCNDRSPELYGPRIGEIQSVHLGLETGRYGDAFALLGFYAIKIRSWFPDVFGTTHGYHFQGSSSLLALLDP